MLALAQTWRLPSGCMDATFHHIICVLVVKQHLRDTDKELVVVVMIMISCCVFFCKSLEKFTWTSEIKGSFHSMTSASCPVRVLAVAQRHLFQSVPDDCVTFLPHDRRVKALRVNMVFLLLRKIQMRSSRSPARHSAPY